MLSEAILSYYDFSLERITVGSGIVLNAMLLFLIKKFSSGYLGKYKYLLAAFAVFDIILCILHGLLNPVAFINKNTFACALYVPWQSHELTAFFISTFTVPFALMNVHFLYRYWSVAHPTRLALFSQPSFIFRLSLYPIAQFIVWYYLCWVLNTDDDDICLIEIKATFYETHNNTIDDGWMTMDHWRDGKLNVHVLYVIVETMIVIFGNFSAATGLASMTYWSILKATMLSTKHRITQYTLLVAVCAQTFVPLVCVYIPYFLCIWSPFLGLSGFGIVDHFSLLISIFPGWDALVIIVLIRDYRQGLLKKLGLLREKKIMVANTQFTTSIQPTIVQ